MIFTPMALSSSDVTIPARLFAPRMPQRMKRERKGSGNRAASFDIPSQIETVGRASAFIDR
jgi:hypothetical protein